MNTLEVWQISINGQVYEADTETLKQWISEGRILPNDKIKKGELSWNDVGRVPMFRSSFSSQKTSPNLNTASISYNNYQYQNNKNTLGNTSAYSTCRNHPSITADYCCVTCNTPFCPSCPKFVGTGKMAICPLCGDMCQKVGAAKQAEIRQNLAYEMGSGNTLDISDFFQAFKYPLGDSGFLKASVVYALMLIIGSFALGLPLRISAYILVFACTAMAIKNLARGRFNDSFLPDFSNFSVMDFIRPIFLGIGVMLVTMTPFVVWCVYSFALLAQLVATVMFSLLAPGRHMALSPITEVLGFSAFVGLIGSVAWAFFYYPIAMAIAGYTESFASVINPLIGIRTITTMGMGYAKAFWFYCLATVVKIVAFIGLIILGIFMGPMLLGLLFGILVFYFDMVNASILGMALYKSADKLGIELES